MAESILKKHQLDITVGVELNDAQRKATSTQIKNMASQWQDILDDAIKKGIEDGARSASLKDVLTQFNAQLKAFKLEPLTITVDELQIMDKPIEHAAKLVIQKLGNSFKGGGLGNIISSEITDSLDTIGGAVDKIYQKMEQGAKKSASNIAKSMREIEEAAGRYKKGDMDKLDSTVRVGIGSAKAQKNVKGAYEQSLSTAQSDASWDKKYAADVAFVRNYEALDEKMRKQVFGKSLVEVEAYYTKLAAVHQDKMTALKNILAQNDYVGGAKTKNPVQYQFKGGEPWAREKTLQEVKAILKGGLIVKDGSTGGDTGSKGGNGGHNEDNNDYKNLNSHFDDALEEAERSRLEQQKVAEVERQAAEARRVAAERAITEARKIDVKEMYRVVYAPIDEEDLSREERKAQYGGAEIWSSSSEVANTYAEGQEDPVMLRGSLSAKNAYIIDAKGAQWNEFDKMKALTPTGVDSDGNVKFEENSLRAIFSDLFSRIDNKEFSQAEDIQVELYRLIKELGHDVIATKNVVDSYNVDYYKEPSTIYAVVDDSALKVLDAFAMEEQDDNGVTTFETDPRKDSIPSYYKMPEISDIQAETAAYQQNTDVIEENTEAKLHNNQTSTSLDSLYEGGSGASKKAIQEYAELNKESSKMWQFLNQNAEPPKGFTSVWAQTDEQKAEFVNTAKQYQNIMQQINDLEVVANTEDDKQRLIDLKKEAIELQRVLQYAVLPDSTADGYKKMYGLSDKDVGGFMDSAKGRDTSRQFEDQIRKEYTARQDAKLTQIQELNPDFSKNMFKDIAALETFLDKLVNLSSKIPAADVDGETESGSTTGGSSGEPPSGSALSQTDLGDLTAVLTNLVSALSAEKPETKTSIDTTELSSVLHDGKPYVVEVSGKGADAEANKVSIDTEGLKSVLTGIVFKVQDTSEREPVNSAIDQESINNLVAAIKNAVTPQNDNASKDSGPWAKEETLRNITGSVLGKIANSMPKVDTKNLAKNDILNRVAQATEAINKKIAGKISGNMNKPSTAQQSQLFDAKVQSRVSALQTKYTKLDASGQLTPEIGEKIMGLWDGLDQVKDQPEFSLWLQQLQQVENEIQQIITLNKLNEQETKDSVGEIIAITKQYHDALIRAEKAKNPELQQFWTDEANKAWAEQERMQSDIEAETGKRVDLTKQEIKLEQQLGAIRADKAGKAKAAQEKKDLADHNNAVQKLIDDYEELGRLRAQRDAMPDSTERTALQQEIKSKGTKLRRQSTKLGVNTDAMKNIADMAQEEEAAVIATRKHKEEYDKLIAKIKERNKEQEKLAGADKDSKFAKDVQVRVDGLNQEISGIKEKIKLTKEEQAEVDKLNAKRDSAINDKQNKKQDQADAKAFREELKKARQENNVDVANSRYTSGRKALTDLWVLDADIDPNAIPEVGELRAALKGLRADYDSVNQAMQRGDDVSAEEVIQLQKSSDAVAEKTAKLKEMLAHYERFKNGENIGQYVPGAADEETQLKNAINQQFGGKAKVKGFERDASGFLTAAVEVKEGARAFTEYKVAVQGADGSIRALKGNTKQLPSFLDSVKRKLGEISQYVSAMSVISRAGQELRRGIQYVREIDAALTELKKVTDETEETYDKFLDTASKTAAKVGSTIKDVISSTADWARLGSILAKTSISPLI